MFYSTIGGDILFNAFRRLEGDVVLWETAKGNLPGLFRRSGGISFRKERGRMSITRGRRVAGFAVLLLLFLPACATYHDSMGTMKKAFPGAKPADAGSGTSSPTDNTAPKTQNR